MIFAMRMTEKNLILIYLDLSYTFDTIDHGIQEMLAGVDTGGIMLW